MNVRGSRELITSEEFKSLMQRLAQAWNGANARTAANCFTDDGIYLDPPDKEICVGREALYEFFGGDAPTPMEMIWRCLAFDEREQKGFGEYSFKGKANNHGVAVVEIRVGRISSWRQYQYDCDLRWQEFISGGLIK